MSMANHYVVVTKYYAQFKNVIICSVPSTWQIGNGKAWQK